MAKKLYVGNLSYDVTEDELSQVFRQCGQVTGSKIIKDKVTGRSKGFGFIEMSNDQEAIHAMERMRGHDLRGRPLMVDEARDKPVNTSRQWSQREERHTTTPQGERHSSTRSFHPPRDPREEQFSRASHPGKRPSKRDRSDRSRANRHHNDPFSSSRGNSRRGYDDDGFDE